MRWTVRGSNSGGGVAARFLLPVQTDQEDHLARTKKAAYFPGLKRPRRGANHPPTSITGVANWLELHIHVPSQPACDCQWVSFTFTLPWKGNIVWRLLFRQQVCSIWGTRCQLILNIESHHLHSKCRHYVLRETSLTNWKKQSPFTGAQWLNCTRSPISWP